MKYEYRTYFLILRQPKITLIIINLYWTRNNKLLKVIKVL